METGCTVIDDLLECEVTILFSFIHRPRTARAAVQQPGIVHTGRIPLMRFQKIHLLLQFVFIAPIVVAFTDRRILSLRPREKNAFRDEYTLRILIFSLVDRFNDVRILCLIFCDDRSRVICGLRTGSSSFDSRIRPMRYGCIFHGYMRYKERTPLHHRSFLSPPMLQPHRCFSIVVLIISHVPMHFNLCVFSGHEFSGDLPSYNRCIYAYAGFFQKREKELDYPTGTW